MSVAAGDILLHCSALPVPQCHFNPLKPKFIPVRQRNKPCIVPSSFGTFTFKTF
jgi:hypothetical protein